MVAFEALSFYEHSVNVNDNDDDHRRSVLIFFLMNISLQFSGTYSVSWNCQAWLVGGQQNIIYLHRFDFDADELFR